MGEPLLRQIDGGLGGLRDRIRITMPWERQRGDGAEQGDEEKAAHEP
ncbi:hypothetical protein WME79_11775 [Sorangium sp. So ce726]